jgi:hypothetical protein
MLTINAQFEIIPEIPETRHAFIVWFDVAFEGPQEVVELSTDPALEPYDLLP